MESLSCHQRIDDGRCYDVQKPMWRFRCTSIMNSEGPSALPGGTLQFTRWVVEPLPFTTKVCVRSWNLKVWLKPMLRHTDDVKSSLQDWQKKVMVNRVEGATQIKSHERCDMIDVSARMRSLWTSAMAVSVEWYSDDSNPHNHASLNWVNNPLESTGSSGYDQPMRRQKIRIRSTDNSIQCSKNDNGLTKTTQYTNG